MREKIIGLVCLACVASGAEKKMIGHGWDLLGVRPRDVAQNLDAWAQVPLDGISMALVKEFPDGKKIRYNSIMTDPAWDKQWFVEDVQALQKCAERTLKHNFITTFWTPGKRLAWDDDAAWERCAHNLGVAAWVAKEGGAKGILIDAEDYSETRQFFWVSGDAPYTETVARARRRGAQVMRSMAREYPDITLLSFWLLSLHPNYFTDHEPRAAMADAGDLWPAFFNGMLDVLPPGARMIDGDEHGYRYEAARKDFYYAAWRMQNKALELVEPENRAKYQTQVQTSFGLYLDMYTNPTNSPWYFGELDGSRLRHLKSNFAQALDAATEYVWIYGEKMDWIKWTGTYREKNPTWEEMLPGFTNTLSWLRDPRGWIARQIEQSRRDGTLTNLLGAGTFALPKKEDDALAFRKNELAQWWWSWQHEKRRQGEFGTDTENGRGDSFSLCAIGVEEGCFCASVKTAPRKTYVVKVDAQGAPATLKVYWRRNGAWDWSLPGTAIRFDAVGADGWRHASGLVQVPEGADELVVMLGVKQAAGERTWFDNAALFAVSEP